MSVLHAPYRSQSDPDANWMERANAAAASRALAVARWKRNVTLAEFWAQAFGMAGTFAVLVWFLIEARAQGFFSLLVGL